MRRKQLARSGDKISLEVNSAQTSLQTWVSVIYRLFIGWLGFSERRKQLTNSEERFFYSFRLEISTTGAYSVDYVS